MRRAIGVCLILAGAALCRSAVAEDAAPAGSPIARTLPAAALDGLAHVEISNGLVSAKVYLPVANGLYQGTRFDHAGVVLHITYKGQDYSQYWFDRYTTDPYVYTSHADSMSVQNACCAVSGPVEDFATVGFDEAGMGGAFLKLGVGILKRNTASYTQSVTYPILNAGLRTTKATGNSVRFTQDIQDGATGYGYRYIKTVRLTPGRPQLTITHFLKNTGRKPIITTVYNHNFLTLSPGNDHMVITAPFTLQATLPLQPELARLDGRSLQYVAPVPDGTTVTSPITGFGNSVTDNDFRVANSATGFGVRMRVDQPLARINFWSIHTVLGWEPYIDISIKPGEVKRWTNIYDYFGPGDH